MKINRRVSISSVRALNLLKAKMLKNIKPSKHAEAEKYVDQFIKEIAVAERNGELVISQKIFYSNGGYQKSGTVIGRAKHQKFIRSRTIRDGKSGKFGSRIKVIVVKAGPGTGSGGPGNKET